MNDTTFQGNGKVAYIPVVINAKQPKPQTRADRIRAMTDEELAVWMVQWTDCYECVARTRGCCQSDESCASSICNWLKQEADNGK